MPEIHTLESVNLRDAWPDEARHFTPWLAGHLDRLDAELGLSLEQARVEAHLPGAGRVDILARQAKTGASVVIENQLELSDDSHLLRLLGYAANAEADILVWVASGFSEYHRNILTWLNSSDSIDVYAVTVHAYRVGDAVAADFRMVVEPPPSRLGASSPARETESTFYANLYRPLMAELFRFGLEPVCRGGWRGRWRSFEAGHPNVLYAAGLDRGKAQAFLFVHGPDQKLIFDALTQHQDEIDAGLQGSAVWARGQPDFLVLPETEAPVWEEGEQSSCILLQSEAPMVGTMAIGTEWDMETTRWWMADNLLRLQAAVQPHLDQLIESLAVGECDKGETE